MAAGLRLDWCSHEAAKYAVEHWHYSRSMPVGPMVRVGVWENGGFIGCVLFSRGANNNLLSQYGLDVTQGCELTRVALTTHTAPVTRIVAIAARMMRRANPGLRLIVSFADPRQDHVGTVYQAGNWTYAGRSQPEQRFVDKAGNLHHRRKVSPTGYAKQFGETKRCMPLDGMTKVVVPGKHRYLMPLDDAMRAQVAPLARPYPKKPCVRGADGGTRPVQG